MPNKFKFRKNRKLKSKMKGGRYDGPESDAAGPSNKSLESAPVAKPIPEANVLSVVKSGGESDYGSLEMRYFIYAINAVGLMGVFWLFISRDMVRHEYSEVYSYSLLALAICFSGFLVLLAGLKSIKAGSGLLNGFKYIFKVIIYVFTKCLPAILIATQLGVLIFMCSKHADILYNSSSLPSMFDVFNKMAAIMVLGQSYVWYKQVNKLVLGEDSGGRNPALIPGFILAAILSSVAISQMYVILEYLKTDC